ncbi:MAG: class I SAM-dependent methyltransferase [Halobacteriota archaeon]
MDLFDAAYEGVAPWDIGRPQRKIMQLEEEGEITGAVLDVGCGTGENALYLAARGHEVWGVDFTPRAIETARDKATQRHLSVTFLVQDVLYLDTLGRRFDTVIDSGLFHALSDEERPYFARSVAIVLRRGGTYFMLCVSELQPGTYGPRRVTQAEIRETFARGWRVNYIKAARMENTRQPKGTPAWLSSITKQ